MKKTLSIFLSVVLAGMSLCGCAAEKSETAKYQIKTELIDVYQINAEIEEKLFSCFELAKDSYQKYQEDGDIETFMDTVHDSFTGFHEQLQANADLNRRIQEDRTANAYLAHEFVEYSIAQMGILNVCIAFEQNDYADDKACADELCAAVNALSEYFCGIKLFD